LVGLIAVAFGILAYASSSVVFNTWVATSSVLIEDPASSQVFGTSNVTNPQRYLATQVAILETADMAEAVQSSVGEEEPLSINEILVAREILTNVDTDLIEIEFVDKDPDRAIAYANAYLHSYETYRQTTTQGAFDTAIAGLDASIDALDDELVVILEDIANLATVEGGQGLEAELVAAINEFLESGADTETAARFETILTQLQTLQVIRALEAQNTDISLLLETRRDLMDRRSQLVMRKDQLQVDSALASTGIVASSEATDAARVLGTARVVLVGVILGVLLGVALAYLLSQRKRLFAHRSEPEGILGIPLLAEIPRFGDLDSADRIPALNSPTSPGAEAFRFAANALVARMNQLQTPSGAPMKLVVVTSAVQGEGKTISTINTALSVATSGRSVLVIDADFGDRALTRMLVGEAWIEEEFPDLPSSIQGLTNVIGGADIRDVLIPITDQYGHQVDVLTRGTLDVAATDLFNSQGIQALLDLIRPDYDYILIDSPPMLQVSYATALVRLADAVVTVIPHQSPVNTQRELSDRLRLIGAQAIGYIYNKAPVRPEMLERRGSMRDPLGTGPRSPG
jgi:Mrp family chromosome partitioning ATPase/capsular polysaccharide biosynthesis protein